MAATSRNAEVSTEELETASATLVQVEQIVGEELYESLPECRASINRAVAAVDDGGTFEDKLDEAIPYAQQAVDQLDEFSEEFTRDYREGRLDIGNRPAADALMGLAKTSGALEQWVGYARNLKRKLEDD